MVCGVVFFGIGVLMAQLLDFRVIEKLNPLSSHQKFRPYYSLKYEIIRGEKEYKSLFGKPSGVDWDKNSLIVVYGALAVREETETLKTLFGEQKKYYRVYPSLEISSVLRYNEPTSERKGKLEIGYNFTEKRISISHPSVIVSTNEIPEHYYGSVIAVPIPFIQIDSYEIKLKKAD
jgi:hypothetical protein